MAVQLLPGSDTNRDDNAPCMFQKVKLTQALDSAAKLWLRWITYLIYLFQMAATHTGASAISSNSGPTKP